MSGAGRRASKCLMLADVAVSVASLWVCYGGLCTLSNYLYKESISRSCMPQLFACSFCVDMSESTSGKRELSNT